MGSATQSAFAAESILVLTLQQDTRDSDYQLLQIEYNRIVQQVQAVEGTCVIFDLSRCCFIDSITVGVLVQVTKAARESGGDAVVAGATQDVATSLYNLMLLQPDNKKAIWYNYDSRFDAITSLPWPAIQE